MYTLCDNTLIAYENIHLNFEQNKHDLTGYHFIAAVDFGGWTRTAARKLL